MQCTALPSSLLANETQAVESCNRYQFALHTPYKLHCQTDTFVDSALIAFLRSNTITGLVLPHVSRETMAGVRSIILHCQNLSTLELKRTRLGYDGILYICSSLRSNTALRRLTIHDIQSPKLSRMTHASSIERECHYQTRLAALTSFWR